MAFSCVNHLHIQALVSLPIAKREALLVKSTRWSTGLSGPRQSWLRPSLAKPTTKTISRGRDAFVTRSSMETDAESTQQWERFGKYHAGRWLGYWDTCDADSGEVIKTAKVITHLNLIEPLKVEHVNTYLGDDGSSRDMNYGTYTPGPQMRSHFLGPCFLWGGHPSLTGDDAVFMEAGMRHDDFRSRIVIGWKAETNWKTAFVSCIREQLGDFPDNSPGSSDRLYHKAWAEVAEADWKGTWTVGGRGRKELRDVANVSPKPGPDGTFSILEDGRKEGSEPEGSRMTLTLDGGVSFSFPRVLSREAGQPPNRVTLMWYPVANGSQLHRLEFSIPADMKNSRLFPELQHWDLAKTNDAGLPDLKVPVFAI